MLHHRASPLQYYYAFMNIAKAYILLRTPTFVDQNLHHGITQQPTTGALRKQKIIVRTTGVFPLFYELVTGHKLTNNSALKVVDLLGYATDVQFEYLKLKYGKIRIFPCKFAIGITQPTNIGFAIIAVPGAVNSDFSAIKKKIEKSFDQVAFPQNLAREIFDMLGEEHAASYFFEGKKEYRFATNRAQLVPQTINSFGNLISFNPSAHDFLFFLNVPIRTPQLAPMQEPIAIYCAMFFLGSLVRYRPEILEAMLLTKNAWIIERFIKSAPLTFLRHIRNLFDGQYLAFTQR